MRQFEEELFGFLTCAIILLIAYAIKRVVASCEKGQPIGPLFGWATVIGLSLYPLALCGSYWIRTWAR